MHRKQRIALITGILVLLFLFGVLGRVGFPWLGRWQFALDVLAPMAMVASALLLTRHWAAPTLVALGILLSNAGLAWREMEKASLPREAYSVLSVLVGLAAAIMLFVGAWLMFRALLRRSG
jgi:hypothetical protein